MEDLRGAVERRNDRPCEAAQSERPCGGTRPARDSGGMVSTRLDHGVYDDRGRGIGRSRPGNGGYRAAARWRHLMGRSCALDRRMIRLRPDRQYLARWPWNRHAGAERATRSR